jgi:hypothetical protein
MLATKYDNVQIGDDVLNLSTTHAIIEQHLVNTKFEFPLSQNNCSDSACDKEELDDNTFIVPMPQPVNEHDAFVLEPSTCFKNRHFLSIATEKDELKLLSSLNTLGYIEFDTLCALRLLICHSYLDMYFTLLANIIINKSIWYIEFIFVQI